MKTKINKRQRDRIWKLLDGVEFELMSLKAELNRSPEAIGQIIEEQRRKLLDASRLTRRVK